ncbi:MAG: sensor histidine kinase [bacterium]|nr:sensor histidine kinase [bacterium]
MLDRLELAGHGEIGALAAARNLQKYVASFEAGLIDEAKLENRFRDLAADVFEVGLPDLEAAAEVAALAQLEPEAVQKAVAALAQLRDALAAAQGGAPANDEESPALRLGEAIANTNERFRLLREIAKGHFSTAPDAVIERSLKANADTITRLGVEVVRPTSPVPDCLIDQKDLAFVLDNLIENALRAMASVTPRRLVIDWRLDGSLVVITVQDTGTGMTAAEARAALEPGEGKRAGGGRGLPGSCRRLKKYEGKLDVGATAPGKGTTMILYLRQATPGSHHDPVPKLNPRPSTASLSSMTTGRSPAPCPTCWAASSTPPRRTTRRKRRPRSPPSAPTWCCWTSP